MSKVAKVPVVLQMENLECGAACLCMVLAYYGKWLPLERVRADCDVSRDGSSAKNIIGAARSCGMEADAYKMEPEALRTARMPVILHWNFNHFVVLNGFKKDRAVINDPARGTVEVPIAEFDKAFTGVAVEMQPGDAFLAEGKPRSVLKFALQRLRGTAPALAFAMLASTLAAFAGMAMPLFSVLFMDNILSGDHPEWLLPFAAAMSAAVLFQFLVAVIQSLAWLRINGRFAITASAEFMWHVLRLPMEFFSQRWAGDLANRQISNENIAAALFKKLAPVLVNAVLLVFYLAIMIGYSLPLAGIGVLAAGVNALTVKRSAARIRDLSRTAQASGGRAYGCTVAGVDMIETIKASGAEAGFFERWAGYFARQHNAQVAISRYSQYAEAVPAFLRQAANIAVLMAGVYLIMQGKMTIGVLLAFQGLFVSFLAPVGQMIELGETFTAMRVEMERVEDVLNYRTDSCTDSASPSDLPGEEPELAGGKLSGLLEMKNVTFGYSRLAPPLIRDFSLTLRPGASVAIVGGSGCGKSTIAKLIAGLYEPWSGEILFDGKPRSEIDEGTFKSSVSMVDQDITLFEDTVADNIRMWDRSIENFAVIMAARDAGIHDVIVGRQDGYAHRVREGGKNFSGGERQRIEIARVLAVEPTILLLDEATSALDDKTEETVMRNVRNLGSTSVVIAHRLSTVRDCDEILVLDRGQAVERGTHEELIALGGRYAQLVKTDAPEPAERA